MKDHMKKFASISVALHQSISSPARDSEQVQVNKYRPSPLWRLGIRYSAPPLTAQSLRAKILAGQAEQSPNWLARSLRFGVTPRTVSAPDAGPRRQRVVPPPVSSQRQRGVPPLRASITSVPTTTAPDLGLALAGKALADP
jgi:hypothetical protein